MNNAPKQVNPAYKQPWFWFVMTPLFMVFIMGFTLLYLSITTNDGVVADNFYKDGLAIKTRNQQDATAQTLNLAAALTISGQQIQLEISGGLASKPDQLTLQFIYPTKSSNDQVVTLVASDDGYVGAMAEPVTGRFQVMLSPIVEDDQSMWRLHATSIFPLSATLALKPK